MQRFKGFFQLFGPTNPWMDGVRTTQEQLSSHPWMDGVRTTQEQLSSHPYGDGKCSTHVQKRPINIKQEASAVGFK